MQEGSAPPTLPIPVLLGIAGIPADEQEKKFVRQATLLLRYRLRSEAAPIVQ
jgi:hypothetical protein